KAYPILAIPKKNTIKFSPAKIKANPLSKLEYERIQWEGIKKEKESKKDKKEVESKIIPNQTHHIATNKNRKYIKEFENIAKKYDLNLDGDWNKVNMQHQGRHPNEYHDYVLSEMKNIDKIAKGDKNKFLKEFEKLKREIKDNPDMLRKAYWKKKGQR
ncbi:AHH domain-containing protein, partial [Helicobacter rodentium]|uniref:AHH domain-containing protein n=1 Tax=Helicobacter rodentium TaxID=59617 RepID=UPI0025A52496